VGQRGWPGSRGEDEEVRGPEQIVAGPRWFEVGYFKRGDGEAARGERVAQSGLIDERAPGGVDEKGGRLDVRSASAS